jgi:hypothetical protein
MPLVFVGDPDVDEVIENLLEAYLGFDTGSLSSGQTITEGFKTRIGAEVMPLHHGPISILTSVKVDGVDVTARFERVRWYGLRIKPSDDSDDLAFGMKPGRYLETVFVQGWPGSAAMPSVLMRAGELTAAFLESAISAGVTSEKRGDAQRNYSSGIEVDPSGSGLPPGARALLKAYRSPRVFGVA